MNSIDFLESFAQSLGYGTFAEAKAQLSKDELQEPLEAFYANSDGTILWSELLSQLN